MDFGPTVQFVSSPVSFCSWPGSLECPLPDLSPHHVWDEWWSLSSALSSAWHDQKWWACVLVVEGTVCAGLTWASSLLGASPLCTLTCLAGPWSGTPATENRSWHSGTKLSCFCCSWCIYHESIMYFTVKKIMWFLIPRVWNACQKRGDNKRHIWWENILLVFSEISSVFLNFCRSLCSLDSCNTDRILLKLEKKSLPLNYNAIEKAGLIKNVGQPQQPYLQKEIKCGIN